MERVWSRNKIIIVIVCQLVKKISNINIFLTTMPQTKWWLHVLGKWSQCLREDRMYITDDNIIKKRWLRKHPNNYCFPQDALDALPRKRKTETETHIQRTNKKQHRKKRIPQQQFPSNLWVMEYCLQETVHIYL